MVTPKQRRFIDEYLVDTNATQAAIRAGYSPKTAYQQGPRLLNHRVVRAEIDKALSERSERTQITTDYLVRRLDSELQADLGDLYDEHAQLKPPQKWPEIWRKSGLVIKVTTSETYLKTSTDERLIRRDTQIILSDRMKQMTLLCKLLKVDHFRGASEHKELEDLGDRIDRALKRARRDESDKG